MNWKAPVFAALALGCLSAPSPAKTIAKSTSAEILAKGSVVELSVRNNEYRAANEHRKRLDVLLALAKAEPENADWAYQLGDVYFDLNWYDDAIDAYVAFAKRYEEDSRYQAACLRVEETLRCSGRYKEALAYLDTLPTSTPDWDIRVNVRKAEILAQCLHTDYDKALGLCRKLVARYPHDPLIRLARNRIAWIYQTDYPPEKRDYRRAREQLLPIIAEFPNDRLVFNWRYALGESYYSEKNYSEAISTWEKLFADTPDGVPNDNSHPMLRYMIASSLHSSGRTSEALAAFRSIIREYPDSDWVKVVQTRIEESKAENLFVSSTVGFGLRYETQHNGLSIDGQMPAIYPLRGAPIVVTVSDREGPITNAKLTLVLEMPDSRKVDVAMRHIGGGKYLGHADFLSAGMCQRTFNLHRPGMRGDVGDRDTKTGHMLEKPLAPHISPSDVVRLMRTNRALLIDVRDHPMAWVKGAELVPAPKLDEAMARLPKGTLIAVYDDSPMEDTALPAVKALIEKGFRAAVVFGGFTALQNDGFPTENDEGA